MTKHNKYDKYLTLAADNHLKEYLIFSNVKDLTFKERRYFDLLWRLQRLNNGYYQN